MFPVTNETRRTLAGLVHCLDVLSRWLTKKPGIIYTENKLIYYYLMAQVAWKNKTSMAHLPAELLPLVTRLIATCQHQYGDRLQAIYLNGGAVRGEWQKGRDIDIIAFIASGPILDDPEFTDTQTPVDFLAISQDMISNPSARIRYRLMILALDGVCAWGNPLDLTSEVPSDPIQFASRLYFDFKSAHQRYSRMPFDGSPAMLKRARRLAKMVPRLANGMAVINGAPFSSSYKVSLEHIKQWAPDWYEMAVACFALRDATHFSQQQISMLLSSLGALVNRAEALGVSFETA